MAESPETSSVGGGEALPDGEFIETFDGRLSDVVMLRCEGLQQVVVP